MRGLIQVIIVGLIVVIAGGLLATFIANVQQEARRMECRDNLKRIGLALHGFHDHFGHFPHATIPNPDLAPEKRFSWLFAIVPYVEGTNLHFNRDWKAAWDAPRNRDPAMFLYKIYQCPNGPPLPPESEYVPAQYIGLSGVGTDAASLPMTHARAGFFGQERKLTTKDIGELATLLVVMETERVHGAWTAGGDATVRGLDTNDPPYLGRGAQFGGMHGKVTNMLFADGSVRSLSSSLDPKILESIATLSGRAQVSVDDF
jgi:prepilin-type processing-associated H-X9-DG protein